MQSQLEGDERWEEVTYFTYAMTIFICIMSSDFYFLVPESFHKQFGSDRHSSF